MLWCLTRAGRMRGFALPPSLSRADGRAGSRCRGRRRQRWRWRGPSCSWRSRPRGGCPARSRRRPPGGCLARSRRRAWRGSRRVSMCVAPLSTRPAADGGAQALYLSLVAKENYFVPNPTALNVRIKTNQLRLLLVYVPCSAWPQPALTPPCTVQRPDVAHRGWHPHPALHHRHTRPRAAPPHARPRRHAPPPGHPCRRCGVHCALEPRGRA